MVGGQLWDDDSGNCGRNHPGHYGGQHPSQVHVSSDLDRGQIAALTHGELLVFGATLPTWIGCGTGARPDRSIVGQSTRHEVPHFAVPTILEHLFGKSSFTPATTGHQISAATDEMMAAITRVGR
jgi:hypothetical protein